MTEKSIEQLREDHSRMLANAVDLGMEVPQELTPDFETVEVGRTICAAISKLLQEFKKGLDETDDTKSTPKPRKSSGAKKPKKPRAANKKADPPVVEPDGETVETDGETVREEENTEMIAKKKGTAKGGAKKAAPTKKAAKKAVGKKAAAHKARDGKVKTRSGVERSTGIGGIKLEDNQKVVIVVKDPPELKKKSKWADRLKKVYAHVGKKVGDFGGSKSDIKWAINYGLIKVS